MKYLKRIFESDLYNQVDEQGLMDFSETYLAYLLDDESFKLQVRDTGSDWESYIIWLDRKDKSKSLRFYWNDIKDSYIPFVKMLESQYDLNTKRLDQVGSSIVVNFVSGDQIYLSPSKLEHYNFPENHSITEVGIIVENTVKIK